MASLLASLSDLPRRISLFLDRPGFPWKRLVLGFSIGQYVFESLLSLRQYQVLKRTKPPKTLEDEVSQEVFDKSQAYGRAKSKFGFISNLYNLTTNVAIYQFDVLPKLWTLTGTWLANYAPERFSGEISHSILFFFTFNFISQLLSLPTSYYSTFVLEEKFGFNKQTRKLFFTDLLKSQGLMVALGTPILAVFLKIIQSTGPQFFYYLWVFAVTVQVFGITIFPIFIQPLFNKLSPLEPGELRERVEKLGTRLKFPLTELYTIDGSKRSAHSNAYFYGLPWKKHIVIYDTLIAKSEPVEIEAVLGHELGHWSLSHTTKLLGIAQAHLFYVFALFSIFIHNNSLYHSFGFHDSHPIMIGFILFSEALSPMDTVIRFLMNILSRKFEFEADKFALDLGYKKELARSLIKLQIENLSTMDADWLYASYHYSHPILTERLKALNWKSDGKVSSVDVKLNGDGKVVKATDREL
ncbi:zinc metalloprotease [Lithohypha guttulata]|uniref:zinc metalloprotease n=1 Tax=Lithohypha guttulata TaxID=1690604 RepID=UPI002DDE9D5F|nr:zinc metalloprotease [Lithohypha guttulata]